MAVRRNCALRRILVVAGLVALAGSACRLQIPNYQPKDAALDDGSLDGAALDAASSDAALLDAGAPDAAPPDAGPPDAGLPDAGPPDAGPPPHNCQPTSALDCSPGTSGGECADGPSCYLSTVQSAINGLINDNPSYFQWNSTIPCWIILDVNFYMEGVVTRIQNQGWCAIRAPSAMNEFINVKHDNAFDEFFDIVTSTGCARSGAGSYGGYCVPAWL